MDRRINYKIVLDTETCPVDKELNEVRPDNMFVYDCGYAIVDKRGKVYKPQSFVIADIFLNEKILMNSSYYANKIPTYWKDIKDGKRTLTSFYNMRQALIKDIQEYNITEIYAHNMRFDLGALNTTQRWLTKSKYRYFFPKQITVCDTLKMARDVVSKMPSYRRFCIENNYITATGQLQLKAEVIYKFIKKDIGFVESHTGLEDVMIEKEILAYCYKQHKSMRRTLWDMAM